LYVTVGHENRICNGPTGKHNAADSLAHQVEAAVLACKGHDYADRIEKESGDGKGEE